MFFFFNSIKAGSDKYMYEQSGFQHGYLYFGWFTTILHSDINESERYRNETCGNAIWTFRNFCEIFRHLRTVNGYGSFCYTVSYIICKR